jgi:hypothetical protein
MPGIRFKLSWSLYLYHTLDFCVQCYIEVLNDHDGPGHGSCVLGIEAIAWQTHLANGHRELC